MKNTHRPVITYSVAAAFLAIIGAWLAYDFGKERERTVAEVARVAIHQSQLISSLFNDTFLAADYVLRDIVGHAELALARKTSLSDLAPLLEGKLLTVRGLKDLVVLNERCTFIAVGKNKNLQGTQSRQRFCASSIHPPGQSSYIQYMPAEKSASGKPVVLMSRVFASPQGDMQFAAMSVMELDYAQHWIEDLEVGRLDVLSILDSDGVLLARNPPMLGSLGVASRMIISPFGAGRFPSVAGRCAIKCRAAPLTYNVRHHKRTFSGVVMSEENIDVEALYEELVSLCKKGLAWAKKHGYPEVQSYPQYPRAREIGELLNQYVGFVAMQEAVHIVLEKVKSKDGGQAALLEYGWDGIGRWRA